jgi:hypothetical protein
MNIKIQAKIYRWNGNDIKEEIKEGEQLSQKELSSYLSKLSKRCGNNIHLNIFITALQK